MRLTTVGDKIVIQYKGTTYQYDKTIKNMRLSNLINDLKWTVK
jgi:hypothetical protein